MKPKRDDWFMFIVVLPFALIGPIILYIGARDVESRKLQSMEHVDSIRPRVDTAEFYLKTKEDSIHFYEDGL